MTPTPRTIVTTTMAISIKIHAIIAFTHAVEYTYFIIAIEPIIPSN